VRLSVGIEDWRDLLRDFAESLEALAPTRQGLKR
jgi:cystathionine beta-lyase/cystathionine gamma-synthase